jgi:hypothetical protein
MPDSRSDRRPCKSSEIVFLEASGAAGEYPSASIDHPAPKHGLADRAHEIAERAHQPETDGGVRDGVMADLLESEIEQAIETDPRYGKSQEMRRIKKWPGGAARPVAGATPGDGC